MLTADIEAYTNGNNVTIEILFLHCKRLLTGMKGSTSISLTHSPRSQHGGECWAAMPPPKLLQQ